MIPKNAYLYDAMDGGGRATQEAKAEHIRFHPWQRRLKWLLLELLFTGAAMRIVALCLHGHKYLACVWNKQAVP